MDAPSPHALGAMVLAVAMFYAFAKGWLHVEIISLLTMAAIALGLYVAPMPGQTKYAGLELAFQGFGHYALITICCLMILGRGLVVTSALDPAARALHSVWRIRLQVRRLFAIRYTAGGNNDCIVVNITGRVIRIVTNALLLVQDGENVMESGVRNNRPTLSVLNCG